MIFRPRRKTAVRTSAITMRPGWLAQAAFVFDAYPEETSRLSPGSHSYCGHRVNVAQPPLGFSLLFSSSFETERIFRITASNFCSSDFSSLSMINHGFGSLYLHLGLRLRLLNCWW